NLKGEHNDQPWAGEINDGSFIYSAAAGGSTKVDGPYPHGFPGYGSMTYAGIKSMIYCGVSKDDPRVQKAYEWIQKHYTVDENPGMPKAHSQWGLYYYYHTMAKCLSLLGIDEVVDAEGRKHDWRADITAALARPQRAHDRTIAVRLAADADNSRIIVNVAYRLEIDEFTVVFDDLPALGDKVELSKLRAPDEFYDAFTRCYAPILAANLLARLDGKPLEFVCIQKSHQLKDENGVPLNHLRCDFVFEARSPASAVRAFWPRPGVPFPLVLTDFILAGTHTLTFREGNYELEEGYIRASLAAGGSIAFLGKTEPDAGLQARPAAELKPGDDARLRILR